MFQASYMTDSLDDFGDTTTKFMDYIQYLGEEIIRVDDRLDENVEISNINGRFFLDKINQLEAENIKLVEKINILSDSYDDVLRKNNQLLKEKK